MPLSNVSQDPPLIALIEQRLTESPFIDDKDALLEAVRKSPSLRHGDIDRWLSSLARIACHDPSSISLSGRYVGIESDKSTADAAALGDNMMQLAPWRKGPFRIGPIEIDSEWRCDLKWQRFAERIDPLIGRRVLDVGGGNGYYSWRMRGAGAAAVLNIDPTTLFLMQFLAIDRFVRETEVAMLPITLEALPSIEPFDTTFSMGVLYHRRDPIAHLRQLADTLRSDGQLVLETLVIPGDRDSCLIPDDRYARMRNVWFLPSVDMLKVWLARSGFTDIALLDISYTTSNEQRSTDWMSFDSLAETLDPSNSEKTIEGHPRPLRAVLAARKKR